MSSTHPVDALVHPDENEWDTRGDMLPSHASCSNTCMSGGVLSDSCSQEELQPAVQPGQASRDLLVVVGNPGTGKSSLLNSLIGKVAFRSGTSWGAGLTGALDMELHNGVTYCDTPGLNDVAMQEQAAAAIKEALQQEGAYTYRLLFVIAPRSQRPR